MDEKRDWTRIGTLVLCVILLGVNFWQGKRISDLEQAVWNAQNSVMDNVSRMDERISSLRSELESANSLVLNWDYTTSVERPRLLVDVSVTLKEWQSDTEAELLWTNVSGNEGAGCVPLTNDSAGTFTGTLERPLSELSGEFTLDVKIINGDTQRQESLGCLGGVSGLLPVQCSSWGSGGPEYRDGVFRVFNCEAGVNDSEAGLSGQVFRLRRNGEIAAEKTAMFGETIYEYTCEELSAEVQPGDKLTLSFFCRDASGLGYEFFLYGWQTGEKDVKERFAPAWAEWPKLTWD